MTKHPRPRLGQVFLTQGRIADRIVGAVHIAPDDVVLEIGAGPGNMTGRLAARGARVYAVELDPRWAAALREKFAEDSRVKVIEADILQLPINTVAREAGRDRIQVFGNLPYYITTPCLMHLFRYHRSIEEIVVMVQQEVAERIVAAPGAAEYGLLSVTCQYYTQPSLLFRIPPTAFRPRPQVHSALVRMRVAPQREALGIEDEAAFWALIKAAFSQKRKTLFNNWKALVDPEPLRSAMAAAGIEPRARAESLSVAQFASLQKALPSRR